MGGEDAVEVGDEIRSVDRDGVGEESGRGRGTGRAYTDPERKNGSARASICMVRCLVS
jgi:hypothetical protein